jgi:hypothetical protein
MLCFALHMPCLNPLMLCFNPLIRLQASGLSWMSWMARPTCNPVWHHGGDERPPTVHCTRQDHVHHVQVTPHTSSTPSPHRSRPKSSDSLTTTKSDSLLLLIEVNAAGIRPRPHLDANIVCPCQDAAMPGDRSDRPLPLVEDMITAPEPALEANINNPVVGSSRSRSRRQPLTTGSCATFAFDLVHTASSQAVACKPEVDRFVYTATSQPDMPEPGGEGRCPC